MDPDPSGGPPKERGVALGLFSADPDFGYASLLREIKDLGASHVSVVWVWWQADTASEVIGPKPGWSATDNQILETLRTAVDLGLHVTAFPIVRLETSDPDQWRGKIMPVDEDRWWESYEAFILHATVLARSAGIQRLSVGSELLSREGMRQRWLRLIDRVRLRAEELELMYSANWDHFRFVSFWDALDVVGLTAYWELTRNPNAEVRELLTAWFPIRHDVRAWSSSIGRPFVFTEVGYPSLDGGAMFPWDETRKGSVDLEEQRRAYEAFVATWSGVDELDGVYFWNWFGFGGKTDSNYTPRDKPAAQVVRSWYRGGTKAERGSKTRKKRPKP